MKRLCVCLMLLGWAALAAHAETAYVTDQLTVPLFADPAPGSAVVKTLPAGSGLEVLERGTGFVRVRDGQGAEGWIDTASLSQRPAAAAQLKTMRAELERLRAQLAQAQSEKSAAAPGAAPADGQLQAEFAALRGQLVQAQEEIKRKDDQLAQARKDAEAGLSRSGDSEGSGGGFSFLWLGIAFAMLLAGFVGGVIWVRESIRRRMGGMYLRI